ncbi:TonB-dependent receptor [Eilatimonas milleporae]|uniref:Iron complex outermembrane receptor protein n=1 Tax=Eilatimonas milleporae TaxID=911205 RepID=A0A3M0CPI2_9PROT|nr:TonB-dependent receptor [Eilatimonas milleporae]RMB08779.1 iron complex outermembrane receptor protein [Eilatimonas milleporae]
MSEHIAAGVLPGLGLVTLLAAAPLTGASAAAEEGANVNETVNEIIVTAEIREKSLLETPVAVSVIGAEQMERQGITSLDGLDSGIIPSLRIQPLGIAPSTLSIAIRGRGPTDPGQVTRDGSVAIYQDGFYLGRAQGLSLELADPERIEVLRGPQGTLYGRNAVSGAVNVISRKPTGELGLRQTVTYGNFDALRTITTLNLPEVSGISLKFDYIHSERDGWVDNTAPGEEDFFAFNKDGGRASLRWRASDEFTLDYVYERGQVEAAQIYHQLAVDNIGIIGVEPRRVRATRFPIAPLDPTVTDYDMHGLTLSWQASEALTVRSLTSLRGTEEITGNNFGGVLYFNGVIFEEEVDQEQFSQEIQVLGSHDRLEWVAGAYYFEEDATQTAQNLFSLDIFGLLTGTPLTPIVPPTIFDVFTGADAPFREIENRAESLAVYGQATWTPPVLDDRLQLTLGLRYTRDDRSGTRIEGGQQSFALETDRLDPLITVNYFWTDTLSTYAKFSTAYRAGGANVRAASFSDFGTEVAETFEFGLKSSFWDNRATLNVALFATDIKDAQLDFVNPDNLVVLETVNIESTVEVDGTEIELTLAPVPGLVIGLNYTYLDGNIPPQPNPLTGGAAVEFFRLSQTPEHAGSATVDYTFPEFSFGTLIAHVDMTATDEFDYVAGNGTQDLDSFALFNARLTLSEIDLGGSAGALRVSVWCENLFDAIYVPYGFPVPGVGEAVSFGTPRTYGFDLTYQF